ncbi:MAG: ester cyclase [Anaerolineae bacterium]|nr:ester cyclase [Anaerolineae bacterium]
MSTETNKAIARRFFEEIWNKGNLAVADELLALNVVLHIPGQPDGDIVGLAAYKVRVITYLRTAFPDLQSTIEEMVAEGDKVVVRWTWRATHRGEFWGVAPTGQQITYEGISILRLADGKIVDDRFQADMLGLMQQFGAIPGPGAGGG